MRFREVEIARPTSRKGGRAAGLPAASSSAWSRRWRWTRRGCIPRPLAPLTSHKVADAADARRIVGFYRHRWIIEQLFRTLKTKGFDLEAVRVADNGPFEKLVTASLIAAVTVLQLVHERDGAAWRPLEDAFDPDDQAALEAVSATLEGKTARQKNPHPRGSLAYAAWVIARLGGWTGYYGKPGPIVMLNGLVQFHAIKHGWALRHV